MMVVSTRAARRLGLLALLPLTLGWAGCGGSSGGSPPPQTPEAAASVTASAKDNYMKSRAERKAQNPGPSRASGRR